MNKYRKLLIDDQDSIYTIIIQCKKWYGWVTIKTIEEYDLEYANIQADEIIEMLNTY